MLKSACLIVAGTLLSGFLLTLGIWGVLKLTPSEPILAAIEQPNQRGLTKLKAEAPFEILHRTSIVIDFALLPSISLIVGCFMGLLATKHAWQLAVISLLPMLALYLAGHSFGPQSLGVGGGLFDCLCLRGILFKASSGRR